MAISSINTKYKIFECASHYFIWFIFWPLTGSFLSSYLIYQCLIFLTPWFSLLFNRLQDDTYKNFKEYLDRIYKNSPTILLSRKDTSYTLEEFSYYTYKPINPNLYANKSFIILKFSKGRFDFKDPLTKSEYDDIKNRISNNGTRKFTEKIIIPNLMEEILIPEKNSTGSAYFLMYLMSTLLCSRLIFITFVDYSCAEINISDRQINVSKYLRRKVTFNNRRVQTATDTDENSYQLYLFSFVIVEVLLIMLQQWLNFVLIIHLIVFKLNWMHIVFSNIFSINYKQNRGYVIDKVKFEKIKNTRPKLLHLNVYECRRHKNDYKHTESIKIIDCENETTNKKDGNKENSYVIHDLYIDFEYDKETEEFINRKKNDLNNRFNKNSSIAIVIEEEINFEHDEYNVIENNEKASIFSRILTSCFSILGNNSIIKNISQNFINKSIGYGFNEIKKTISCLCENEEPIQIEEKVNNSYLNSSNNNDNKNEQVRNSNIDRDNQEQAPINFNDFLPNSNSTANTRASDNNSKNKSSVNEFNSNNNISINENRNIVKDRDLTAAPFSFIPTKQKNSEKQFNTDDNEIGKRKHKKE